MTDTLPSSSGALRHKLLHLSHPEVHIPGYEMPDTASPPLTKKQLVIGLVTSIALAVAGYWMGTVSHHAEDAVIAAPWMLPFVLLLASIAIMPFIAKRFWEHNYNKVAIGLGLVVTIKYLFFTHDGPENITRSISEYISFIFLLGSLFVVSGGIFIRVRARGVPLENAAMLVIGAVLANVFGTTGASMLLIRPFLRMNKGHLKPYHVIFFIFVVSNVGGSLTPIGDPPLFLGYLTGVPFFWVFEHCWQIWALVSGLLICIFIVIDSIIYNKETRHPYDGKDLGPAISFYGVSNLMFVMIILIGVLGQNTINAWTHEHLGIEGPWREILMAIATFGSLATTSQIIHGENHFNYAPIKEVAYLFIGIFLTMVPALNYLYHNSQRLHLTKPSHFYFASGTLSSVLDNAPTYLTFLKTKMGSVDQLSVDRVKTVVQRREVQATSTDLEGLTAEQVKSVTATLATLNTYHEDSVLAGKISDNEIRIAFLLADPYLSLFLIGISIGSVFFGAMTYIGNGPNFMVKSIADHAGATTPGFFRYIYAFSLPVLLPLFVLAYLMFLR